MSDCSNSLGGQRLSEKKRLICPVNRWIHYQHYPVDIIILFIKSYVLILKLQLAEWIKNALKSPVTHFFTGIEWRSFRFDWIISIKSENHLIKSKKSEIKLKIAKNRAGRRRNRPKTTSQSHHFKVESWLNQVQLINRVIIHSNSAKESRESLS